MLLDEKEAFFKRVQDRVVFSRGSAASDPVDVMVRFSELAPNFILGEIPGTNATHATLEPVFNEKSDAFYCKMESVFPSGPARLASSTVWFRSISRRGWNEPQPADEPLHIVGEFECAELLIDERNLRRDLELRSRSITFYLPEGGLLWGDASQRLDFQAFTLRPSGDEDIDPGIECLFTMKGTPCLIYDRTERTSTRTLSCILPTLVCSTKEPEEEYSDDAFHADARRLVDDVLLLASLACRRVIRWHRYNSFGRHGQQTLVRSIRLRSQPSDRTYVPELPVALYRFHDFVRLAIPKLRELREQDLDLQMPLLYMVGSHETTIIDEKLSYAVLCIERLVDLYARSRKLDRIVPAKFFDAIRRRLTREIDDALQSIAASDLRRPSAEATELMREKLMELNRPPFWTILSGLLDTYGVPWKDLYPAGIERPTFISTRNKFIHSSKEPSYKHLLRESKRVQVICERILFRMLGWEEPRGPLRATLQWLARPEEEA